MTGVLTSHGGLRPDAKAYIMAGRGVVVDAKGRGDFTTIQDACDYWKARSIGGRIWVRAGTYEESVSVDLANITIEGESWDTIVDGGTTGHGFHVKAGQGSIRDMQVKTTGGGGNTYAAIALQTGAFHDISRVYIPDSDSYGIANFASVSNADIRDCYVTGTDDQGILVGGQWRIIGCYVGNCGNSGIYISVGDGDDTVVMGCTVLSNTGYGILIGANDENCVIVGNRVAGNSTANITDNSGTSTVTGNDTT